MHIAPSNETAPNIVLIFPDQWRGDCLGSTGHPAVQTPFLDELAADGTRFSHAYTPSPTCIPARACLATGLTPSQTGRLGYRDGIPWAFPNTFMRLLRDSGYQTMCSGKTHFSPSRARLGFEELALYETRWQDPDHPSDYHQWLQRQACGTIRDTAEELDSNSWVVAPWTHPEPLHPNSWTITAAIDQLERRDPLRPFMLQVGFHRPHSPYDPPQAYYDEARRFSPPPVPTGDWTDANDHPVERINTHAGRLPTEVLNRVRQAYYAQINHLDFQIGRLMRYLRGRRLMSNTWIIFTSDHGDMLGDHHLFRKTVPFEGSANIPLIIHSPMADTPARGVVSDVPVTLCDLMPTILDIGGIAKPGNIEAVSLLPHLDGGTIPGRDFIHGEHAPGWQYLTDGRAKYIWNSQTGQEWFFDLVHDHQECHNLAGVPAEQKRLTEWRQRLVEILAPRVGDGLVEAGRLIPGRSLPAVRDLP